MKLREGSLTALVCGCVARCGEVTCDGAEEAECGRVALVLVDHPLGGGHGHGDGEGDRLVELAPPGLDGHNGRHRHPVTKQLRRQLGGDGLGLAHTGHNVNNNKEKIKIKSSSHFRPCALAQWVGFK